MVLSFNKNVINHYIKKHKSDKSDKLYPNLILVRSINFLLTHSNEKILDYACGYGANSIAMAPYAKSITYADTSKFALQKTQKKFLDLKTNFDHKREY